MTTSLFHLQLPHEVFSNPVASVCLPIVLGTTVGYTVRPRRSAVDVRSWKQPPLHPPPYVYGPVWTLLYGLMGYAAYRAVGAPSALELPRDVRNLGATLYTVQLGLNLAWMPLFFGLRRPIEATVDSVLLLGINAYLAAFWLERAATRVSGWCFVPYVAWCAFATYLCAGTGYLNNWKLPRKAPEQVQDK